MYLADFCMDSTRVITLYRPALYAIAYNLVRCRQDAEDIVQETLLNWLHARQEDIRNVKAYLFRSVINSSLNHLKALNRRKTEYFSSFHRPEFINRLLELDLSDLDLDVRLEAMARILHSKLGPLERAVFILREGFDFDYADLQVVLQKKQEYCRQLFSRARKKVQASAQVPADVAAPGGFLDTLKKAFQGNMTELIDALKRDAWFEPENNS
jgi:RNA polymerase sigma factor (sigma-70 family)